MNPQTPTTMMSKPKPSWVWHIFFYLFMVSAGTDAIQFFRPDSPQQMYYKILWSFNSWSIFLFLANALAIILNLLAVVPFVCFLENQTFLSRRFWQGHFVARLLLLGCGYSYALKEFQSYHHQQPTLSLSIALTAAILYLPSYIATFLYAFKRK